MTCGFIHACKQGHLFMYHGTPREKKALYVKDAKNRSMEEVLAVITAL